MASLPTYGTAPVSPTPASRPRRALPFLAAAMAALVFATVVISHAEIAREERTMVSLLSRQDLSPAAAASAGSTKADLSAFLKTVPGHMRSMVNAAVDPCDDFHEFACGTYEDDTPIPADKSGWAYSWDGDSEAISHELSVLIHADKGKAGDYLRACMNTGQVETLGLAPTLPWVQLIDNIHDMDSLAKALARMHQAEIGAFFDWWLATDDTDPTREVLMIDQGGTDLPDASYYVANDTASRRHRKVYREYADGIFGLYGYHPADVKTKVHDMMSIETSIANHAADDNALTVTPRYNLTSLAKEFPGFPWKTYFTAWDHADIASEFDQISVTSPSWLKHVIHLMHTKSMTEIKNYLLWHLFFNVSPLMGTKFFALNLVLDHNLYGVATHPPRWQKCVGATKAALPFLVSKLFVDKYFPPSAQAIATKMLENIRSSFKHDLEKLDWIATPETRAAALDKLHRIFFEVGYPSSWPQYHFEVDPMTYFANSIRASQWRTADKMERLRHPVMRHRWTMSPATVNAYYDNGVNGVFVPAGLLQPPFFNYSEPLAHSYGSSGAIMAHELTHGFDNSGRKYDAHSRRRQWWDAKTIAEFKKRSSCIAKQYDTYKIAGSHVDGNNTLGENIADIGGLKMAYKAWRKHEKKDTGHEAVDAHKKLFWLSFAQSWCGINRRKVEKLDLITDVHSPDRFRIIGPLSLNEDFAKDYKCPAGSKMNPQPKCKLW